MNKKPLVTCILLAIATFQGFSQEKILEHKTDIKWEDGSMYNYRWLIGSDFLAQPVNRKMSTPHIKYGQEQVLYIFDLKNKKLAKVFDQENRGWYFVAGSGTTSSFLLGYTCIEKSGTTNAVTKATTSFWKFDEQKRDWKCSFSEEGAGPNIFGTIASSPLVPGYYVQPKRSEDNKVLLQIYKY